MDRLDELAIFLAVVDEGSLAAASRKLRRSPPAVTRALAELEDRVGARLVERTTRRSRVTEAGRRLAEHARSLLAGYELAVHDSAASGVRGLLRITAPIVFGRRHVAPVVASFLDAHPGVRVEMVLSDRNLVMIQDGLDVAVRIGALADSSLVARKVGEVRRLTVASPSYLAARPPLRTPADLARHEVIFNASTGRPGRFEWRFAGDARETVVPLVPRLIVNEVEAALLAVRAGRGVARLLSYQVADDLASGSLVRVLGDREPAAIPVQVVVPSARHLPVKTRSFVDHAVHALSALEIFRIRG